MGLINFFKSFRKSKPKLQYNCQKYIDKEIKPNLNNRSLATTYINLLGTTIYCCPCKMMEKALPLLMEGKAPEYPIASTKYIKGYNKVIVGASFDTISSCLSNSREFSHDWWHHGHFDHSVAVYQHAKQITEAFYNTTYIRDCNTRWLQINYDSILLGAFLHDIGKTATRFPDFKGVNTQYMHEYYGYEILQLAQSKPSCAYAKYLIAMVGKGHSGYWLDDETKLMNMKSKKYCTGNNRYRVSPIAPYIVCFADKLEATASKGKTAEYRKEKKKYKQAKASYSRYYNACYEDFIKNAHNHYKVSNNEITYNNRTARMFTLTLHE